MADYRLCAFADEASPTLAGQIAALHRNGIKLIELRSVGGRSVVDLADDELEDIAATLAAEDISVWSVGSPLGKTRFDERDEHERRFERSLAAAKILGAEYIRMFSFYVSDEEADDIGEEIVEELDSLAFTATLDDVTLCHENEKGIYGSTAARTLELLRSIPLLGSVFDPANFVQCGEDPAAIFADFAGHTTYLHIKDALADGTVVPAGEGDAGIREILRAFRKKDADRVLSVEPHLTDFVGLGNLQNEELLHKYSYASPDEAFDAAVNALKKLLDEEGISYE